MPRRSLIAAMLVALTGVSATACRPPAPIATVAPAQANEDYCWWAVYRSPLPADTVAARFAHGYAGVGLAGATWAHAADTAWAQAGPTVLGGAHAGGTYAARVVAYRRGDSTHFRPYVSAVAPPGGWPQSDSTRARGENGGLGRHLGFCAALGRAAQVQGTAPREPDGEETLHVWRRRP